MTAMADLLTVTPLVPAGPSLADAIAFYTAQLGFTVVWQADAMAGVRRGKVEFSLVQNDDRSWADNASFQIGVADLDGLYEEYKSATVRVGLLERKSWGRREFHMILPSGVCLQFHQASA